MTGLFGSKPPLASAADEACPLFVNARMDVDHFLQCTRFYKYSIDVVASRYWEVRCWHSHNSAFGVVIAGNSSGTMYLEDPSGDYLNLLEPLQISGMQLHVFTQRCSTSNLRNRLSKLATCIEGMCGTTHPKQLLPTPLFFQAPS
ncbi:hypothetical protein TNCV_2145791 [Trichonephila clavipes]|uniref:Uncharacterized protein n=1 Tax=Trichonephila clavipes TaxID=2585209 RepID=A0A8X6SUX6_TRICX|nr:hypothetical protein TNCV_2145791 [Trichonephila clavipes]